MSNDKLLPTAPHLPFLKKIEALNYIFILVLGLPVLVKPFHNFAPNYT